MALNRHGMKWSAEETILAFYLYCRIPFSKIDRNNTEIIRLAELLGRTPSSVGLKLTNLAHFDPELQKRNVNGMSHASKLDEEIVKRFSNNWDELAYTAKSIEAKLMGKKVDELISLEFIDIPEGNARTQLIKARVNQNFFREAVLSSYQYRCCITDLAEPQLLIASHIKPWAKCNEKTERTNPANGLCLNALHDRAFDRGLITILPDLTVKVSRHLKKNALKMDDSIQWLVQCDGKKIRKPERFVPNIEFLKYHNDFFEEIENKV